MTGRLANLHRPPTRDTRLRRIKDQALHIVHITDPHTLPSVENLPDATGATAASRLFWGVGQKLDQVVNHATVRPPDVILATGDLVEAYGDWSVWMNFWNAIPPGIQKFQVPGNHDYFQLPTLGDGVLPQDYVAAGLGQTTPYVAESPFNQSAEIAGPNGMKATLILIDSCIDPYGRGAMRDTGFLQDPALTWLEGALAASPHDLIVLASHHGPHNFDYYDFFDNDDAHDLRDIVNAEVAARPNRKIRYFFGHNHKRSHLQHWNSLGRNLPGVLAPALVELGTAAYVHYYLFPDGSLYCETSQVFCSRPSL